MSYNREWDHGKSWDNAGYRGYSRGRDEDDYYTEGKRRKYNNGGYQESWSSHHDGEHYGNDNNYDYDYGYPDNYNNFGSSEYSHDNRDDRAYRDRGPPRKRHVASEPSPHVIFLGLDADFTEVDLQNFLKERGFVTETVTIIRDRNTGQSKGFGFAQFRSTEEARSFVDPNFPFISVPPPVAHGASAAAAYRLAEESGAPHGGKRVKIDYSQSASAAGHGRRGPQFSNDGTRDIGNSQSAVLLFRGLDPLSGPAAVAQAMKFSSGPDVEGAKGMKRVILIKDKATMASWGYAFVEFVDIQAASAVLAATMSPQLHPNGFRISDRPVAASFAHPYSFQCIEHIMHRDENCIASSLNLGGVEGSWAKYWDESASLASMDFKVEEPQSQQQTAAGKEKKDKEKKRTKASADGPSQPTEASTLPVSNKPVTLSFNKVGTSVKTANTSGGVSSQAAVLLASHDEDEAANNEPDNKSTSAEDELAKKAQRVPPMIASRKVVNNITKWNQVQEELSGTVNSSSSTAAPTVPSGPPASVTPTKEKPKTPEVETEFEFSDTKAMTCLLCSRAFKSLDQLKRHNKESELHKKNLKDANLRDIAREKARTANAKKKDQSSDTPNDQSSAPKSQYRNRALERRILFNQPDVPPPESGQAGKTSNNKRSAEGPAPVPSPPPPAKTPGEDASNIGNKLLKMMGWTEGSGLGTEGEGRVDPIQTAIYASGAGLGSSKGREVGKYQEGYSGYVQIAKDVARERYGQ
ncbi:uncharacterized protein FOMMEDRAFT_168630 [Fomitiporia mediterranea MF3/22]|uniref:uncharacterized protein n=1 Tax=Fomitiporia mediterranea (strain MF3/22) TaxID=694068 RepID=UPI0004409A39|nr:uncharacterized protein FOMMEDRAFT_168630 [Fomitiporia mediterranea MF3/22]EJD02080.1 hypothetical protein FOMMEDRAFT_168630 [Fomitiporia mediterranea MF3/22]